MNHGNVIQLLLAVCVSRGGTLALLCEMHQLSYVSLFAEPFLLGTYELVFSGGTYSVYDVRELCLISPHSKILQIVLKIAEGKGGGEGREKGWGEGRGRWVRWREKGGCKGRREGCEGENKTKFLVTLISLLTHSHFLFCLSFTSTLFSQSQLFQQFKKKLWLCAFIAL